MLLRRVFAYELAHQALDLLTLGQVVDHLGVAQVPLSSLQVIDEALLDFAHCLLSCPSWFVGTASTHRKIRVGEECSLEEAELLWHLLCHLLRLPCLLLHLENLSNRCVLLGRLVGLLLVLRGLLHLLEVADHLLLDAPDLLDVAIELLHHDVRVAKDVIKFRQHLLAI